MIGAGNSEKRRRGQPIVVFGALILFWVGGRTMLWQSPFPAALPILELPEVFAEAVATAPSQKADTTVPALVSGTAGILHDRTIPELLASVSALPGDGPAPNYGQPTTLASHQALWMAALAYVPVPEPVAELLNRRAAPRATMPIQKSSEIGQAILNRWSLDAWLLWRPSSTQTPTAGPLPASYGGSQAGAVLRYQFAPNSKRRPNVYLRATSSLSGGKESDLAAGLSARVVPKVPVSANAELRVSRSVNRTELRASAFVVTELPQIETPLNTRVSTYAQAGYVGGDFGTLFVDGQATLDREIADFDLAKIRLGAGTWGGAQKGASRLDVGPTASLDITIGDVPARLSMDYRHRVAGDAVPQSGLAITLSTGF